MHFGAFVFGVFVFPKEIAVPVRLQSDVLLHLKLFHIGIKFELISIAIEVLKFLHYNCSHPDLAFSLLLTIGDQVECC